MQKNHWHAWTIEPSRIGSYSEFERRLALGVCWQDTGLVLYTHKTMERARCPHWVPYRDPE